MKTPFMRRIQKWTKALGLALLLPGATSHAQTFQQTYHFDAAPPWDGTYLYGKTKWITDGEGSGYISLTQSAGSETGTFIVDSLPPDQLVGTLRVDFQVRIIQGTLPPADGISFNFGPNLLNASIGEGGVGTGLSVTFDTFDNGDSDSAPAIEVVYDGQVKGGATFAGRARAADWPLATDSQGNPLSLQTGVIFVPVSITLDQDGNVSVWWDGNLVLSDIPTDYKPVGGWRIGFGARTGASYEEHDIDNLEISGTTRVRVVVESAYGANLVSPPAGEYAYLPGETLAFEAPPFVYLDRYRNPLEPTAENIGKNAYYRARYQGVSIDGGALSHAQENSFTVTPSGALRVVWEWQLEYLGEIDTGTADIAGLSAADVTDIQHSDTLGRHFYGPGAGDGERFTSIVRSQVGGQDTGLPVQFAAKGYVLENAPTAVEHSAVFSPGPDHLRADNTGIAWSGLTRVTVEFWMRRDPSAAGTTGAAVSMGRLDHGPRIFAGFAYNGHVFFGEPGGGGFEFGGYSDFEWHHWAFTYDQGAQQVAAYRDGKLVFSQGNTTLPFAGMEDVVTIGAALGVGRRLGGLSLRGRGQ